GFPIDIAGPCFSEAARQREQHGSACQRSRRVAGAQLATAGVYNQGVCAKEGGDLVKMQFLIDTSHKLAGGGSLEHCLCLYCLRQQCRYARALSRLVGTG